jgi:hypothetical protein
MHIAEKPQATMLKKRRGFSLPCLRNGDPPVAWSPLRGAIDSGFALDHHHHHLSVTLSFRSPSLTMDHDRKSTTSSFYGRKNSMDALNSDYPQQQQPSQRPLRDDASSFFNPEDTMSRNADSQGTAGGYNGSSYYNSGRKEPVKRGHDEENQYATHDDAWDVYADFNNAGPRYSKAPFGSDG